MSEKFSNGIFSLPIYPTLQNSEILNFIKVLKKDEGISTQGYFRPDNLVGTNNLEISIFGNDDNNQLIISSRLDNLGKGASGAAIQCMNIALGFNETIGL